MKKIYNSMRNFLIHTTKARFPLGKVLFNDTELRFCVTGLLRYKKCI